MNLQNASIVVTGASVIEGAPGTPCATLLDYEGLGAGGALVRNEGHGGYAFWDLSLITSDVQAWQDSTSGPDVLVVSADPCGNMLEMSVEDIFAAWLSYVDGFRTSGWNRASGRRLVVTTMHTLGAAVDPEGKVPPYNALIRANWQAHADLMSDAGADPVLMDPTNPLYFMPDQIHPTLVGGDYWAQLLAADLVRLTE